jgi:hypothetical protein
MSDQETTNGDAIASGVTLVPWEKWMKDMNLSRATAYRHRIAGRIVAITIFGKLYVSRAEIARFEERAKAGEFARHRAGKAISASVEESPAVA